MAIFDAEQKKDALMLVFDIGSSSVGGALFYADGSGDSGIPKIIFAVREPVTLEHDINAESFLSAAVKALDSVTDKINKAGLGAPKDIFCVIASPWYVSQTRIIKLEKNTPFIFTTKLADSLIQKEISLFEEQHLAAYVKVGSPVRVIELKNIKTVLNGYETLNPIDQKTKTVEMTIFISIAAEQVLKKIEDAIKKHFHFNHLTFSSFALASFAVVRDMYISQENFLLIDVGGEVTDISMIKKNILRESISFPLGTNFMIRGVASLLACSLSEAKSYISLIKDGHASVQAAKNLDTVLAPLKKDWLDNFQKSLANLSNDISIPATIYITMRRDLAEFFCQLIKREQFNQYTLAESNFKITFLGTEVFHGLAQFEESAIRDAGLIMDSIYINRFFNTP